MCFYFQKAPKGQLLVYNVKESWEPLCKFLGKEVPNIPFPHKNVDGKDITPEMENHPLGKQIRKEFFIFLLIFIVFMAVGIGLFLGS